jgi:ketosteroid isomerase-like protein
MTTNPVIEDNPIVENRRIHAEASKAGDAATVASLYCADAVFMPPNDTSLFGRTEVQEWWEDYFAHFQIVALTETDREITMLDGWAIERWSYTVAILPINGGDRIRDDGRVFALWRRDPDGKWRTNQAMYNSIRPIGSGTSRFLSLMKERRSE